MSDISLVGVRLVVEGQQAATGQLAEFDAKVKASTESLKEMGGPGVNAGLQRLVISVEDTSRSMDKASVATEGLASKLKDLDSGLSSASSSLMHFTLIAGGVGLASVGALGTAVVGFGLTSAASFERSKIAFDSLTGSVATGNKLFADLQAFNLQTPFGLPDITQATQTLLNYGFTAQNVLPVIKTLANVASAAPANLASQYLQSDALALGQMFQKGQVQGQEILQFTNAGFPIQKILQQVSGLTPQQLQAAIHGGGGINVPSQNVVDAISAGTGPALQPYQGAAVAASQSLSGQWSNFTDNLRMSMATASQPLVAALEKDLTPISDGLTKALNMILPQLNDFFTMVADKAPDALSKLGPFLKGIIDGLEQHGPMIVTFFKDAGGALSGFASVLVTMMPVADQLLKWFNDLLNLPFGSGQILVGGLLTGLLAYNALSGVAKTVLAMAGALNTLTDAEARHALLGKAGVLGKVGGGLLGAGGLTLSAVDAYNSGPSLANVAGGAASGALLGATVGSAVPVIGTAVGAGAGAIIGGGAALISGEIGQHHVNITHNVQIVSHDTKTMHDQMDAYYRENGRRDAQTLAQLNAG